VSVDRPDARRPRPSRETPAHTFGGSDRGKLAIYTSDMFSTGNDVDNRAAVRGVPTDRLDLVGVALRAPHRDADAVLRGLARHP
jgi:hypothetical protein